MQRLDSMDELEEYWIEILRLARRAERPTAAGVRNC
jgi:hypothetical protein